MTRVPAKFRQADIARAIKAVQQTGADMRVRLAPDGSIVIEKAEVSDHNPIKGLDSRPAVVM